MKKPGKSAAELEALLRVEMEQISELPTHLTVSVQPDGDTWKVVIAENGVAEEAGRFEMINLIADRLRCEFDLKG